VAKPSRSCITASSATDLRPLLFEQLQRAGAAVGFEHSPATLGQSRGRQHAHDRIVVHQQDRPVIGSGGFRLRRQSGQVHDRGLDGFHRLAAPSASSCIGRSAAVARGATEPCRGRSLRRWPARHSSVWIASISSTISADASTR